VPVLISNFRGAWVLFDDSTSASDEMEFRFYSAYYALGVCLGGLIPSGIVHVNSGIDFRSQSMGSGGDTPLVRVYFVSGSASSLCVFIVTELSMEE
jgi:hypothetical protein